MNCYKADPVSREDIRRYVRDLKRSVGLENVLYFRGECPSSDYPGFSV